MLNNCQWRLIKLILINLKDPNFILSFLWFTNFYFKPVSQVTAEYSQFNDLRLTEQNLTILGKINWGKKVCVNLCLL